jgi:hypothetical protein
MLPVLKFTRLPERFSGELEHCKHYSFSVQLHAYKVVNCKKELKIRNWVSNTVCIVSIAVSKSRTRSYYPPQKILAMGLAITDCRTGNYNACNKPILKISGEAYLKDKNSGVCMGNYH